MAKGKLRNKKRKITKKNPETGVVTEETILVEENAGEEPEPELETEKGEETTNMTEVQTETARASRHAHWIHHKRPEADSLTGFFYLPGCDCSNCGYTANLEKKICPSCGAVMDEPSSDD